MFSNRNQIETIKVRVVEDPVFRNDKKEHFVMPSTRKLLRQYEAEYCTQFKSCKRTYNSVFMALPFIFF